MFGRSSAFRGAVIRWEIGLLVVFVLLGVISVSRSLIIARSMDIARAARVKVDSANEAKYGLELLISRLKDAETGQRGFLLTQNEQYLETYDLSLEGFKVDFLRLRPKLEEHGVSKADLDQVNDLFLAKYEELRFTVEAAKSGDINRAISRVRDNIGKDLMDKVRLHVSRLNDHLNVELAALKDKSDRSRTIVRELNFFGAALSIVSLALLFWLSWKTVHNHFAERAQKVRRADELERAVQQRTQELNLAKEELEAFSYSVSHDLRGPLRAVISYAGIVQEDYGDKLDAEANESLERIKASGRRMSELIDTLLALSRLSRTDITVEPVDASQICESILADLGKVEESLSRTVDVKPGITLHADRKMLTTLLDNLLRNAWKFSSRSPSPRIEVGVEGPAIYIRDNGVGFNAEYANKLFLPFQRLHNDREFEGTGIGLAIVDRIVKRHGGKVWAVAEEGKGATFYFQLATAPEVAAPLKPVGSANGR